VNAIKSAHPACKLEIEVDGLDQLKEAIGCQPDVILLDNMELPSIIKALELISEAGCGSFIEISGNWTPQKAQSLEKLSLKRSIGISMGFITHTTRFLDLSLEWGA
jgi:nicotinate-nucleotide pyrophosphorylase (carboxylating)